MTICSGRAAVAAPIATRRPIRVTGCADPRRAVIGSTFTFKMEIARYLAIIEGILRAGADHRRMGSTALMMCHVADGRLDACATGYCNSWDVIGGLLLVEEAGGVASDFIAENGLLAAGSASPARPACVRRSSKCATAPRDS